MKKERERESVSKERRRRRIRTIFRERRSDLRTTHKRSYYHFAPRLGNFHIHTTHHHHHRILSEAIFSAHRFCEGPPFQKAKHFSTSDGNSKKSVSSPRMCVCLCVCTCVLASAHLRIFVCERRQKESRRQRTYLFYSPLRVDFFPGRDTVTVHGCVRV